VFNSDHGLLPPANRISNPLEKYSQNEIEIYNRTSYKLTVLYSGDQSYRFEFKPFERRKFKLALGEYRVVARVNDPSVTPFAGEETMSGGEYSEEFYIVTSRYKIANSFDEFI
jgi:hypothetical protein